MNNIKKYTLKEWEEIADKEGYTGEYRQEWLRHCQLMDEASLSNNDEKWYAEANWFLDQNLPYLFPSPNKQNETP